MEYPKILYVTETPIYPFSDLSKELVGKADLADQVPNNKRETQVATYQLVGVSSYRKTVTKTSLVEEVK